MRPWGTVCSSSRSSSSSPPPNFPRVCDLPILVVAAMFESNAGKESQNANAESHEGNENCAAKDIV
jgi:hypothetical protein